MICARDSFRLTSPNSRTANSAARFSTGNAANVGVILSKGHAEDRVTAQDRERSVDDGTAGYYGLIEEPNP
jgi:hypothetical protein